KNRFRVKSYSSYIKLAMPQGHYLPVLILRGCSKTIGSISFPHPGLVSANPKFVFQSVKEIFIDHAFCNLSSDPMIYRFQTDQTSSKYFTDCLLTQTNTKHAF